MDLTLVILAAGMGSRFGGPKQFEPVSAGGATLMDYAVWDAHRAGFVRVVVVLRPDLGDEARSAIEKRYRQKLHTTTVLQRIDDVPAGRGSIPRVRPWGTAQAVIAARYTVAGPFAVINSDDFYGAEAYQAAASFLRVEAADNPATWALIGYRLADTLSPHGTVNRALCRTDSEAWLRSVEEVKQISGAGSAIRGLRTSGPRILGGEEDVSMNFWALTPAVFEALDRSFERFLGSVHAASGELLLPEVIQEEIRAARARVRLLRSGRGWFGLTHPADRDDARATVRKLIAAGEYPDRPWS